MKRKKHSVICLILLVSLLFACPVQGKAASLSAGTKANITKLIKCFDTPVGFLVNPAMLPKKKLIKLNDNFILAVSTWNVSEKYWKEFGDHPYGMYSIQKKYVDQKSQMIFNKKCSLKNYPRYSDKDFGKSSYFYVSSRKNNMIVSGYSSPYRTSSKITKIAKSSSGKYKVYVTYYAKNAYTNKTEKTMKVQYTLKKNSKLKYGYYVSAFRCL